MSDVSSTSLRERLKDETRQIILDAFASCIGDADVEKVTYADIAKRAGIGTRTVFRHFPARADLLRGLYHWVAHESRVKVPFPESEQDLIDKISAYYSFLDEHYSVAKAFAITPQGYETRMAVNSERKEAYLKVLADASKSLSDKEKTYVAAAFQHMSSITAWLAMRENWDLTGHDAAEACRWAIRAMLNELHAKPPRK